MAPPTTHTTLDSDNDEQAPYVPPTAQHFPNCTAHALDEALDIWRVEFKAALKVPTTYADHHDHLTDGFQLLSQLSHRLNVVEGKITEHLTPVMKDMYFRGWKQEIHRQALIDGYQAWRNGLVPVEFTPPAGQRIGPKRARRRKVAVPGNWLGPLEDAEKLAANAKGKGKEEGEKAKKKTPRGSGGTVAGTSAATATIAPTPAITPARATSTGRGSKTVIKSSATVDDTDDEEEDIELVNDPPCGRCRDLSYVCTVQEPAPPKKAGGKPVVLYSCAPCGKSKNKCSLVPPPAGGRKSRKISEEVSDGGQSTSKAARAPRVRKKPSMMVVPAGGPGEASTCLVFFIIFSN